MISKDRPNFVKWMAVGIPLLLAVGIAIAFLLRFHFGLPIKEFLPGLSVLFLVQIGTLLGMFFAKSANDLRLSIFLSGLYCLCIGVLGMRYASHWHLMAGLTDGDYLGFVASVVLITLLSTVLLTLFGKQDA